MKQHEATAESQYRVCTPGTPTPAADAPLRKLAVFVTHGMGQQVPFATLDAVFERLRRLEPYSSARPEAETVRLGGQQMQRLVLRLPAHSREIHFYEGYWAPLTEGEVTLRDISAFLLRAGLNGIFNSTTTFSRWIFGRWQAFDIPVRTWAYLVVALATIGSLALMNGIAVVVSAARAPLGNTPAQWLSDALFCDLTTTLNVFLVIATVFLVTLGLSRLSKRAGRRWVSRLFGMVTVLAFATTLLPLSSSPSSTGGRRRRVKRSLPPRSRCCRTTPGVPGAGSTSTLRGTSSVARWNISISPARPTRVG